MRLLLAKDRLSTLDHQGSDQPAMRPNMVDTKSNQSKTKLNGYPAVTLRRSCAGCCAGCRVSSRARAHSGAFYRYLGALGPSPQGARPRTPGHGNTAILSLGSGSNAAAAITLCDGNTAARNSFTGHDSTTTTTI
eukprot:scaffold20328_cov116-Isochrysis_galbana.AAC.3